MPKRAFVLINAASGKAKDISVSMARKEVLSAIGKIDGVILAQVVTGPYEIARIHGIEQWTVCLGIEQAVGCQASNLLPVRSNG